MLLLLLLLTAESKDCETCCRWGTAGGVEDTTCTCTLGLTTGTWTVSLLLLLLLLLIAGGFVCSPVPGTVLMISHRFGSLLNLGDVRALEKCDVQFFCFSISSRELNLRSGFSGFSGFGRLTLKIFPGTTTGATFTAGDVPLTFESTAILPLPFVAEEVLPFRSRGATLPPPLVIILSGLETSPVFTVSLDIFPLIRPAAAAAAATGRLTRRLSTPNFSNKALALLKRAAWDSVRTTGVLTASFGDDPEDNNGLLAVSNAGAGGCGGGCRFGVASSPLELLLLLLLLPWKRLAIWATLWPPEVGDTCRSMVVEATRDGTVRVVWMVLEDTEEGNWFC